MRQRATVHEEIGRGQEIAKGEEGVHAVGTVRGPVNETEIETARETETEIVSASVNETTLSVQGRENVIAIAHVVMSETTVKRGTREITKSDIRLMMKLGESMAEVVAAEDQIVTRTEKGTVVVVVVEVCGEDEAVIRGWIGSVNCGLEMTENRAA